MHVMELKVNLSEIVADILDKDCLLHYIQLYFCILT